MTQLDLKPSAATAPSAPAQQQLDQNKQVKIIPPTYLYQRETEYFGWTPLSYVDQVINIVNNYTHLALDSLQEFIDAELGDCMENEKGMQQTASLLESCVDKNFDRWELFCLQHVFYIPPSTPLPGSSGDNSVVAPAAPTEQQEQELDCEIAQLRKKLIMARKTREELLDGQKKLDRYCEALKRYNRSFAFVADMAKKHGSGMADECAFVADQVKQLSLVSEKCRQYDDKVDRLASAVDHQQARQRVRKNNELDAAVADAAVVMDAIKENELFERLDKAVSMEKLDKFQFKPAK